MLPEHFGEFPDPIRMLRCHIRRLAWIRVEIVKLEGAVGIVPQQLPTPSDQGLVAVAPIAPSLAA
jgi:hypothetical protein